MPEDSPKPLWSWPRISLDYSSWRPFLWGQEPGESSQLRGGATGATGATGDFADL